MVEPIKLLLDENEREITIGKCCVCGEIWDLKEYESIEPKRVQRYLDGMPLNFSEKDTNERIESIKKIDFSTASLLVR